MTIHCPICKKDVALASPDFPFCSERCRLIDLGKWASEDYKISEPAQPGAGLSENPEDDE